MATECAVVECVIRTIAQTRSRKNNQMSRNILMACARKVQRSSVLSVDFATVIVVVRSMTGRERD